MLADTERAITALYAIPPDLGHDEWVRVGMAAKDGGVPFDKWNAWSAGSDNYSATVARTKWQSFQDGKGVGVGTLYKIAAEHGWRMGADKPQRKTTQASRKAVPPSCKTAPGMSPAEVWSRCDAASYEQPYITQKRAAGVPLDGLRVLPSGDRLVIQSERMAGALVVPVIRTDGTLSSLQFIALPDVAARLKAREKTDKPNLPGTRLEGWFTVGELLPGGVVHICEGIGTAWSC